MSGISGIDISSDSDSEEEVASVRESRKHIVYQTSLLELYKQVGSLDENEKPAYMFHSLILMLLYNMVSNSSVSDLYRDSSTTTSQYNDNFCV